MSVFDIFLTIILLLFIWKGFRSGLIGALGGLLGIIIGIWAGSNYMLAVSSWIMENLSMTNEALANILSFIAIFIAVNLIIGLIISIINRIFHIIPFIDFINKLAGGIIGFIGGILAIAALVYLLSLFPISGAISDMLENSSLAGWSSTVANIIKPLLPEAIKELQTQINF